MFYCKHIDLPFIKLLISFLVWVDQVIKEHNDIGTIRGKRSRALFEPKGYKEQQMNLIKSIFDSNGFISKYH